MEKIRRQVLLISQPEAQVLHRVQDLRLRMEI